MYDHILQTHKSCRQIKRMAACLSYMKRVKYSMYNIPNTKPFPSYLILHTRIDIETNNRSISHSAPPAQIHDTRTYILCTSVKIRMYKIPGEIHTTYTACLAWNRYELSVLTRHIIEIKIDVPCLCLFCCLHALNKKARLTFRTEMSPSFAHSLVLVGSQWASDRLFSGGNSNRNFVLGGMYHLEQRWGPSKYEVV